MEQDCRSSPRRRQTLDDYLTGVGRRWLYPALALALMVFIFAVHRLHLERAEVVRAHAAQIAQATSADLQRRLHGLRALVVAAGGASNASLAEWHRELRAFDRAFSTPVALVDSGSQTLVSSRLSLGAVAPAPPQVVQGLIATAHPTGAPELIGDLVVGSVVREPLVPMIVWVGGSRGLVLVGAVLRQSFQDLLDSAGVPRGWRAELLDSSGNTVASTGDARALVELWFGGVNQATQSTTLAAWTVSVRADAGWFFAPHAVAMMAFLSAACCAVLLAQRSGRRASARLVASIRHAPAQPQGGVVLSGLARTQDSLPPIEEVESIRAELLRLQRQAQTAQSHERERIARDLHDGLQQEVAVARLNLEAALMDSGADRALQQSIQQTLQSLDKVGQEIRQVVKALRPATLEHLGLGAALAALARQLNEAMGVQVELEIVGEAPALERVPAAVADAVFRIVQESLNNVRKHAQASFVHLVVEVDDPAQLSLSVSDDGVGLPQALAVQASGTGHGLQGMAERAAALGATLNIRRGHFDDPQRGTTVSLRVPL